MAHTLQLANKGAALALAALLTLVGCATRTPNPDAPDPPTVPVGPSPANAAQPDGPPQQSPPPNADALRAPRDGGTARRPVVAGAETPVAFPAALPSQRADPDTMVAHFIDVGQGDATLLEFSCGAVLIDTGGEKTLDVSGRKRLMDYLELFFAARPDLARTLKLVVLSHPHLDHTDGVAGLLAMQPEVIIENVLDNGAADSGSGISGQKALQKYARDNEAGYQGLRADDIPTTAGVTNRVIDPINCRQGGSGVDPVIAALWGRVDEPTGWANNANNDSVIVRVDFGQSAFLFTGDMQKEGIEAMLESYSADLSAFDVDVLKVGHHGSHNATTPALVAAVTPTIAIIQAGDSTLSNATFSAYSFAHPHRDAVNALLHPTQGVKLPRAAKTVRIGVRGRNPNTGAKPQFTNLSLDRSIHANGWDGNIAVFASSDGSLRIESEF